VHIRVLGDSLKAGVVESPEKDFRRLEEGVATQLEPANADHLLSGALEDSRARILIVDDEAINVEILADIFENDYQIKSTMEGRAVLEIAANWCPDVILLDVMMPDADGYEICRVLKNDPRTRGIIVIFITGLGDISAEVKGLELGAADYVSKPINPAPIRARVASHIKLKHAQETLAQSEAARALEKYIASVEASKARIEAAHSQKVALINESLRAQVVERTEAERKYRSLFNEAVVGIFQITQGGFFASVNPAMARIFGYASPDEMMAVPNVALWHLFTDPIERNGSLSTVPDSRRHVEREVERNDGSKIWLSSRARAVYEDGKLVCVEGTCEDVTERKVLGERLQQAQKLESVGQLAAGIAHEINTPIQYIGDNVRFLKDAFEELVLAGNLSEAGGRQGTWSSPKQETESQVAEASSDANTQYLLQEIPRAIDQTLEGVARVATLISAMKDFSHPGTNIKIPLDLNRAILSTITITRNEWKYVAEVGTDLDEDLPMVDCLPGEFNQVILNIVVNAAHAIGDVIDGTSTDKGKISVSTRNHPQYVEIRIKDTGSGIPADARLRIFDPFFTTKEIGKGTGQGLAIARSIIVDQHNGSINFETSVGKGTTFIIRLPHESETRLPDEALHR